LLGPHDLLSLLLRWATADLTIFASIGRCGAITNRPGSVMLAAQRNDAASYWLEKRREAAGRPAPENVTA
jgi:hypothetical protein